MKRDSPLSWGKPESNQQYRTGRIWLNIPNILNRPNGNRDDIPADTMRSKVAMENYQGKWSHKTCWSTRWTKFADSGVPGGNGRVWRILGITKRMLPVYKHHGCEEGRVTQITCEVVFKADFLLLMGRGYLHAGYRIERNVIARE